MTWAPTWYKGEETEDVMIWIEWCSLFWLSSLDIDCCYGQTMWGKITFQTTQKAAYHKLCKSMRVMMKWCISWYHDDGYVVEALRCPGYYKHDLIDVPSCVLSCELHQTCTISGVESIIKWYKPSTYNQLLQYPPTYIPTYIHTSHTYIHTYIQHSTHTDTQDGREAMLLWGAWDWEVGQGLACGASFPYLSWV